MARARAGDAAPFTETKNSGISSERSGHPARRDWRCSSAGAAAEGAASALAAIAAGCALRNKKPQGVLDGAWSPAGLSL